MVNENANGATDVLALVDDLFFQAKLVETARKLGVVLKTVSTGAALVEALGQAPDKAVASGRPRLVVVDLNARQGALDPRQARGLGARAEVYSLTGLMAWEPLMFQTP